MEQYSYMLMRHLLYNDGSPLKPNAYEVKIMEQDENRSDDTPQTQGHGSSNDNAHYSGQIDGGSYSRQIAGGSGSENAGTSGGSNTNRSGHSGNVDGNSGSNATNTNTHGGTSGNMGNTGGSGSSGSGGNPGDGNGFPKSYSDIIDDNGNDDKAENKEEDEDAEADAACSSEAGDTINQPATEPSTPTAFQDSPGLNYADTTVHSTTPSYDDDIGRKQQLAIVTPTQPESATSYPSSKTSLKGKRTANLQIKKSGGGTPSSSTEVTSSGSKPESLELMRINPDKAYPPYRFDPTSRSSTEICTSSTEPELMGSLESNRTTPDQAYQPYPVNLTSSNSMDVGSSNDEPELMDLLKLKRTTPDPAYPPYLLNLTLSKSMEVGSSSEPELMGSLESKSTTPDQAYPPYQFNPSSTSSMEVGSSNRELMDSLELKRICADRSFPPYQFNPKAALDDLVNEAFDMRATAGTTVSMDSATLRDAKINEFAEGDTSLRSSDPDFWDSLDGRLNPQQTGRLRLYDPNRQVCRQQRTEQSRPYVKPSTSRVRESSAERLRRISQRSKITSQDYYDEGQGPSGLCAGSADSSHPRGSGVRTLPPRGIQEPLNTRPIDVQDPNLLSQPGPSRSPSIVGIDLSKKKNKEESNCPEKK